MSITEKNPQNLDEDRNEVLQYCFSCPKGLPLENVFMNMSDQPYCFDHLGCFLYDSFVIFSYDNSIHFEF